MAHVKVERRSMSTNEWIKIRCEWLCARIQVNKLQIANVQKREARQIKEKVYDYVDEAYLPLQVGDQLFRPDGTAFIKATFSIPDELISKEVWLQIKTAAEMHVKNNDTWLGGLDPNRSRLLLTKKSQKSQIFNLEIEAYNRSKPDDERDITTSNLRGCRQTFTGAYLVEINHEIEAAYYDVKILIDTIDAVQIKEEIRNYITQHLNNALNMLNHEETDLAKYLKGIGKLRSHLADTVFNSKETKNFRGTGKVALVAHSHLDIAYFWRRIHTVQKNARTCMIQLRLMDKYPDFKYAHTQAYTYELLEKYYPELFKELKKRVEEGRFELAGAMYIEPDCNIPSAESLIRQCFYGQHYYRKTFKQTVRNCWLPDVFGNSWILPQILKKCEIDYFVSNKMSTWNDTNLFPHNNFIWKGIDGSELAACVPPTHFITWNTPDQIIQNWEAFQEKETSNESMNMFGFGDGGSGVTEQMLEYLDRMNKIPGIPEVRHCRGDEFLEDNFSDVSSLDTWDGELYLEMHRGTFTTKGELKKANRKLEILLRDAEILASFAALQGASYPSEDLEVCWKKLLVNQFHDILTGTHIAPVTKDALDDYESIEKTLNEIIAQSGKTLLGTFNDKGLTCLNTLSQERKGIQFIPHVDKVQGIKDHIFQTGARNGISGFWVDIPHIAAGGSLNLIPNPDSCNNEQKWYTFSDNCLETPYFKVKFNSDGSFSSLLDKKVQREIVTSSGTMNKLAFYHDYPGTYDAWDILPDYAEKEDEYQITSPISIKEVGPLFITLSTVLKVNNSEWKQTIRFFRNEQRIEVEHEVDWHERNRLAKVLFDVDILSRHFNCDTGAGFITRPSHQNTSWEKARFEVCHHKWADVSENGYGIAILNESKYGISVINKQIGLSLLRGSIRPDPCADEGQHRFMYAILPHDKSFEEAEITATSWEFNTPLLLFNTYSKLKNPLFTLNCNNIHIQAIKAPENGENAIIIRLTEQEGKRGTAQLKMFRDIHSVNLLNMLEDDEENNDINFVKKGILHFAFKPFEINTFKLTFFST